MAADEAAGEPEVVRVVDVVGDGSDDLHAVVDETDHCQHDPGNQQASLALWVIILVRFLADFSALLMFFKFLSPFLRRG